MQVGRRRRFRRGASIIVQGDHSDTVIVLLRGSVKVTLDTADGHEMVLCVLQPGDLLGEFEAIAQDGGWRNAGNVALEPVDSMVLTGDEFRTFLEAHPRSALALLRVVIGRLQAADRRRIDVGVSDTVHCLARLLVEIADQQGGPGRDRIVIALPLTQHELAGWISASRDSVVRSLTRLRDRGLVETGRRQITVRDLDGLRQLAEMAAPIAHRS